MQKVPPLYKMALHITSGFTTDPQGDIMPGHSRKTSPVEMIVKRFVEGMEIIDARVRVIFAWPGLGVHTWRIVGEGMISSVVSAIAEIETTDEGNDTVYEADLFVVGIKEFILLAEDIEGP
jgi:hypothetical protein